MIGPLHIEIALAAGYAGFLIVVASGLEWFGRHSHRRSGQFRTAGFKYHGGLDVWECPCGHHLHPHYRDPVREIVRYRAPAHTCTPVPGKTTVRTPTTAGKSFTPLSPGSKRRLESFIAFFR